MTFKRLALKDINFGEIAAEAEVAIDSGNFLLKVFQDPFHCIDEIEKGKIFVFGRKGTGKSAIASVIERKDVHDLFHRQLKFSAANLESLVQGADLSDRPQLTQYVWEWLLLCAFGELLLKDQSLSISENDKRNLSKFFERNRGYCAPNASEILETVRSSKLEVQTEYLKRIVSAVLKKDIQVTEGRAPFYKILEPLKELIIRLVTSHATDRSNRYVVLIDDLDIGYISTTEQNAAILSLLRTCSSLYSEMNRNGIRFFPVVFLRTDMLSKFSHEADARKFKEAFGQTMNWYDQLQFRNDESEVPLRKMIAERIRYSYERKEIRLPDAQDPWETLFDEDEYPAGKSSFKNIVDLTLYRPRDMVSLFNQIKRMYPRGIIITRPMVDEVLPKFSGFMVEEWKNELGALFSPAEIEDVFLSLSTVAELGRFNLEQFGKARGGKISSSSLADDEILEIAFQYGMIGNIGSNGHMFWKHRETQSKPVDFRADDQMTLQICLATYFKGVRPGRRRGFGW